jgi:hypothetical protein
MPPDWFRGFVGVSMLILALAIAAYLEHKP